jgi:hypothetical protein
MMLTAQIGESTAQRPSILLDAPLHGLTHYSGLLGNQWAQGPTTADFAEEELWPWATLNRRFGEAHPASKLGILKRRKFTAEGRDARIQASLAALDAPQPTNLTLEQWREIIEEVEDEDEE